MYSIKLRRSLYGLKQSGRMWYNRLSEYLIKEGYINDPICPCTLEKLNIVWACRSIPNGILVHQSAYTKKNLKRFYMDNAHSLSTPMVVRSLDRNKDPFHPKEDDEMIGALLYLAQCTRPDIAFSVNLLVSQTLVATSSNHAEILALCEASRECVWLRSLVHHIRKTCDLSSTTKAPTIMYEDNTACIAQIKEGFIKGDRTKHISPKFFYLHELQKNQQIEVKQIRSQDNLADLFTKALPKSIFQKLVDGIGMRQLYKQSDSSRSGGDIN
ncbi:unnamed protein product [Prunus brigantina]